MAVALRDTKQCVDFFQQTIVRTVRQWQTSDAVQQIDVPVLDKNRLTILNIINRGLEYQPSWPELKELVIAFASYMERRGHWDVWRDVLQGAIAVAQMLNDVDAEITLTALFARLSQRQSRGDDVVRYYRRVIRLAKRHGNQLEQARACSNLGFLFIDREQWWRSEVLSHHALAIFEALGNKHGRAHTHNHLGLLYTRQGFWGDAEKHLKCACDLWRETKDLHSLIYGLENLGLLFTDRELPQKALIYLREAEVVAQSAGEEAEIGKIWLNMGIAYRQEGELQQAIEYTKQAEKIFQRYSNHLGLAQAWGNLGISNLQAERWDDAYEYLQRSLETFQSIDYAEGEMLALLHLMEYALATNNNDLSIRYFSKLEQLFQHHHFGGKQSYLESQFKSLRQRLYGDSDTEA